MRFNEYLELDLMFIFSNDKSNFFIFSQIANILGAWGNGGHLKSACEPHTAADRMLDSTDFVYYSTSVTYAGYYRR